MGENTRIQWTNHTFNPWRGCQKVSKGCANCYADAQAKRNPGTLGIWGPEGSRVVASESMWKEPLKWNAAVMKDRCSISYPHQPHDWCKGNPKGEQLQRPRVFCASMADVFEDWNGPMHDARGGTWSTASAGHWWNYQHETTDDDWGVRDLTMDDVRRRLFNLIQQTPNLDWLLLTKRPENILKMWPAIGWPDAGVPGTLGRRLHFDNVWIGTSVEDQETADARIPHLLKVPAKVRFLSMEPLLHGVDIRKYLTWQIDVDPEASGKFIRELTGINWAIIGGESGSNARPFHIDWCRSIVKQCQAANVPVFVKQMGARPVEEPPPFRGIMPLQLIDPKGGNPDEWPEDLRIRELP